MAATQNTTETWKPVVGFEGRYSVSNLGRIQRQQSGKATRAGRIFTGCVGKRGYMLTTLSSKTMYVHHLVAAAYLGPCPPNHEINHKDTNKINNRADNLEYITHAGNMAHAGAHGIMHRKLNSWQVRVIRHLFKSMSQAQVARVFNVSSSAIHDIWNGVTWRHC